LDVAELSVDVQLDCATFSFSPKLAIKMLERQQLTLLQQALAALNSAATDPVAFWKAVSASPSFGGRRSTNSAWALLTDKNPFETPLNFLT
jgi:hypothetical protein